MENATTGRAPADAGSRAADAEVKADASIVRPLPGTLSREARSRVATYSTWPSSAEVHGRVSAETDLMRTPVDEPKPPRAYTRPAETRSIEPELDLQSATVEQKRPALRGTAKHSFDELKINFLTRYGEGAVKSILFLGLSRGDGVSTAAYNFAKSLAQDADTRVLLINADLRASSPPESAHRCSAGVTSIGEGDERALLPARQGNVHILPSGSGYADPAVLFQSRHFTTFLRTMSERYDYIVIDGPPLDEAPECMALGNRVDGVVLVLNAAQTRGKLALRAKKRIQDAGGKLLGVVLNRRRFYVPGWLYRLL